MIFMWVTYEPRPDVGEEVLGWFLTWTVAIWMPVSVCWFLYKGKGSLIERIKSATSPSKKWGPYLDNFRKSATHLPNFPEPSEPVPNHYWANDEFMELPKVSRVPEENYEETIPQFCSYSTPAPTFIQYKIGSETFTEL